MKKKHTIFLVLIMLAQTLCFGQLYPFEDALQLRKELNGGKFSSNSTGQNEYLAILANYHAEVYQSDTALVSALMKTNVFLKELIPESAAKSESGSKTPPVSLAGAFGSLGGTNVTNLADGLAKFLAERTKEELEIAFFSRMKDYLEKHEKDFGTLFPQTFRSFSLIDEEIYDFKKYISMIREAFHSDMRALPENIQKWLASTSNTIIGTSVKPLVSIGCGVAASLLKGEQPGELLHKLSEDTRWREVKGKNLSAAVKMLDFFSQSLRSRDKAQYWISKDAILNADALVWRIYFGLLYEQSIKEGHDFQFEGETHSLQTILHKCATTFDSEGAESRIVKSIKNIANATGRIQRTIKALGNETQSNGFGAQFLELSAGFLDLLEQADDVSVLALKGEKKELTTSIITTAKEVLQLAGNIQEGHYALAIADLALLVKSNVGNEDDNTEFVNSLLQYGGFLALLTEAESSDQVNDAIKMYALPAGSSRIKKESDFNIALQAYVGGFYQCQKDAASLTMIEGRAGFTAPVGISFSKGFDLCKSRSSLSLFVSAVDIGSLVQFRLVDDSSTVAKDISLANIFSPGAGLVWGVPKLPLSVGGTYSAGPLLSKVIENGQNLEVASNRMWSWRFFIALDIPILNFYNVSRKMK